MGKCHEKSRNPMTSESPGLGLGSDSASSSPRQAPKRPKAFEHRKRPGAKFRRVVNREGEGGRGAIPNEIAGHVSKWLVRGCVL